MANINNYENVFNYNYASSASWNIGNRIKQLKNLSFSFLEEINLSGLPQGLCITDEYIFITSYSEIKTDLGECRVFDRVSGEHLVTLGMDKNSHLGGIAFDGSNIWVCNSSKMAVERLSYDFIRHVAEHNRGSFVNVTNIVEVYVVKNIPSSISFYNDSLYILTHTKWSNSKMISYHYDVYRNTLEHEFGYKIPPKVQGMTFDIDGNVYLSTSYGRKNSSYIKKYRSIYAMTKDVEDYLEMIEMPPCSEGLMIYENKLYVLFESAGKKYLEGTDGNGKSIAPLDKILIIDLT